MQAEMKLSSMQEWLARADELAASGRVDLADIKRIDTAGAAFLLELTRRARRKGTHLEFVNASQQVRGLLEFLQINDVLKLA